MWVDPNVNINQSVEKCVLEGLLLTFIVFTNIPSSKRSIWAFVWLLTERERTKIQWYVEWERDREFVSGVSFISCLSLQNVLAALLHLHLLLQPLWKKLNLLQPSTTSFSTLPWTTISNLPTFLAAAPPLIWLLISLARKLLLLNLLRSFSSSSTKVISHSLSLSRVLQFSGFFHFSLNSFR